MLGININGAPKEAVLTLKPFENLPELSAKQDKPAQKGI
jgi:hypothetical protein